MTSDVTREVNEREVLLAELAEARDDERSMFAVFATILSVAFALVVTMVALLFETCPEGSDSCPADGSLTEVPTWAYLGAPVLPTALMSYALILASIQTLRSYYLRSLELRIHDTTATSDEDGGLIFPSWSHLALDVTGQADARRVHRMNWLLLFGMVTVLVGSFTLVSIVRIEDVRVRILAIAFHLMLLATPVAVSVANARRGAEIWHSALERLPVRLARTRQGFPPRPRGADSASGSDGRERSLAGFVVLPRPQEELLKAAIIPGAVAVVWWMTPELPRPDGWLLPTTAFWLVFELLVYQARYLLNDVRDRHVDALASTEKRRFPASLRNDPEAIGAAFVSFVVRIVGAALVVGTALPIDQWRWAWHTAFLVAVLVIAVPYERFRGLCTARATDGSPTDVRDRFAKAIIAVVALGYGLRIVVGAWLAGIHPGSMPDAVAILTLLFVGGAAFGTAFVAATWALESTRAVSIEDLAPKAHLIYFREALPRWGASLPLTHERRVLRPGVALRAPYASSAVLASVFFVAAWLLISRSQEVSDTGSDPLLLAAGSLLVITSVISMRLVLGAAFTVMVSGAIVVTVLLLFGGADLRQTTSAALLGLLGAGVVCQFRNLRWDDLPDLGDKVVEAMKGRWLQLLGWFARDRLDEHATQPANHQTDRDQVITVERVASVDEALDAVGPNSFVLCDLEGTLTDWCPSRLDVATAVQHLRRSLPDSVGALVVSNAAPPPDGEHQPSVIWRAGKPDVDLPADALEAMGNRTVVVIGDQMLTDGRFARRLARDRDVRFVLVDLPADAPRWPRLQRRILRP